MILSLTSESITKPRMYDVADSVLAQKLSQVPGIGQVFVGGGAKPAVRAEVNPTLLNKLGVGWWDNSFYNGEYPSSHARGAGPQYPLATER